MFFSRTVTSTPRSNSLYVPGSLDSGLDLDRRFTSGGGARGRVEVFERVDARVDHRDLVCVLDTDVRRSASVSKKVSKCV
jgi:hypothetical protein